MKRKILSLLTLLVVCVTGAWAETTIFSMSTVTNGKTSVPKGATQSITATFNSGSSAEVYNGHGSSAKEMISSNAEIKLGGSSASYFHATFTATLEEGDIITSSTENSFYVSNSTTKGGSVTFPYTIKSTDTDLIGSTNLYVWKDGGSSFTSFTITRPEEDYASPVITTDLSTTPIAVDVNVGTTLTIVAEHVTGFQWYRNSSASTDGAEEIDGATSSSYAYSAPVEDAESTVYFYCVVTNTNAKGDKTATSSFAQINVGSAPTLTAVTNQVWNIGDFSAASYTTPSIVNNLEIKNGTIDGGSKSIDGFTLSKRIKINKDESASDRYIKFKIDGPCIITVYGMSGGSEVRTLGVKVDGSEVATLSQGNSDLGKVTYTYTGDSEVEVVLFCKVGSGTFNVHGITVSDVHVDVSSYEWATFVSSQALTFNDLSGVEAYIITGNTGSAIDKTQLTGTVPANTALLIKGEANTTYFIPLAGGSSTDVSDNKLKAGSGDAISAEVGKTKYVLAAEKGAATFLRINEVDAVVSVGKAYLEFSGAVPAPSLRIVEEGQNATGVNDIEANVKAVKFVENGRIIIKKNGIVYDALGRVIR